MQLRDNYKYTYIPTGTTTQVLIGQGSLVRIIIGVSGGGSVTVYDSISGTSPIIALLASTAPVDSYEFGIQVIDGIRVVTGGTSDITVVTSSLPS